jgi:hypothetical protein
MAVRTDITGRVRKLGWSSRLCNDEDSNDRGSIGIGSGSHPRRFEQRHERKEVWGNGRDPVQSVLPTLSAPIRRKPKWYAMLRRKSEEAIVAMKARTTEPAGAKGLYLSRAFMEGGTA